MKYCKKCLQPDTRPGIYFNEENICGACLWEEEKKSINWQERENELYNIVDNAKSKATGAYDCAIGVSGGKDSTFQAFYAKEILGLRPLLVNCEPIDQTEIGKKNIENLKNQGFDVISISPNRNVLRQCMIKDFWKYLNPLKATEYTLHSSTYIIAHKFKIPLIIQGENDALTLGIKLQDKGSSCFNITSSNTLKNNPLNDYVDDEINYKDLFLYQIPINELLESDIQGIWLNYFYKDWSNNKNAFFAVKKGFSFIQDDFNPFSLGTYRRFNGLDSFLGPCNQYFKYIKFGFGHVTDVVCYDLRDQLITRDEGKYLIKELDGVCGQYYINKMCSLLGIDQKTMFDHAEKFRGDMFYQNEEGSWKIKNPIWEIEPIQKDYKLSEIIKRLDALMHS